MTCKNCNNACADGVAFCPHCGAALAAQEPVAENPAAENVVTEQPAPVVQPMTTEEPMTGEQPPVYSPETSYAPPAEEVPAKPAKSFKPIALVAGVMAALVLAVCLLAKPVQNLAISMGAPEKHVGHVYATMIEDAGDSIDGYVDELVDVYEGDEQTVSGSLEVEINEDVLKDYNIDRYIGDINSAKVDYKMSFINAEELAFGLVIDLEKEEIIEVNAVINLENGKLLLEAPALTKETLELNLEEMGVDLSALSGEEMEEASEMMVLLSDYIDPIMKDILPELVKVAFKSIDNVEREKETFTANGVDQKATCLTIEVDEQMLRDMAAAVLEELATSKDVKNLIKDLYEDMDEFSASMDVTMEYDSADAMYDEFVKAMEEALNEVSEPAVSDEVLMTLKTWVNGSNEILAVSMSIDGGAELFVGKAKDGNKVGYEISMTSGGYTLFEVLGKGTQKGNKLTAEFVVEVEGEGELLVLETEDLDIKKLKKGEFDGKIVLSFGEELLDTMGSEAAMLSGAKLSISGTADDKKCDLEITVRALGSDLCTVRLKQKIGSNVNIKVSDKNTQTDPIEWAESMEFDKIIDRLEKAGVSDEIVEQLRDLDPADLIYG